ncbi:FecCD family ABC transporter permease [Corynebacterium lowii]|uniref:Ferric enterobactin transport system permease protein FepD n=1 Tax=Corynebacterium lowii TaxID=1544413 RepID=A0A0Q0Z3R2_9CORY|nr:iron chelate uptake ABC transporter family permease subunit [Corynebacterium lowii]KQB83973.1 Ferric enterobactin transport system permease protein FepD [Corynebacterium lowii]MDP9852777.1 iron complex transport system permease protein [Corynebacterium lowii]
MPSPPPAARTPAAAQSNRRRALSLVLILAALVLACGASLAYGSNPLAFSEVWEALWHRDDAPAMTSAILWEQRWPRTLVAVLAGIGFGVAGALIQALTRNPLADPGLLGVNAGAGFAIALGVGAFGLSTTTGYIWCAFIGAGLAAAGVYAISATQGAHASPATLVLAGVALGAVLTGITRFLSLTSPDTFEAIRHWSVGSVAGTSLRDALSAAPLVIAGLLLALALASSLNSLALGDDLAAALGTKVGRTRVLGIVALTLLAGSATAITGGISFVGLMIPHVVRWFVGPDQRWIIAYSALCAPVLVLAADTVGRVVARPGEIEAGIITALLGAPVLIALARRKKAGGL